MKTNFHAGNLRAARQTVAPHIPELAPQLGQEKHIILNALQNAYAERGHDPESVTAINWNKAERHTIASFCINEQIDYLVEGEGVEARFKDFQGRIKNDAPFESYIKGVRATQINGARYVMDTYANGHDPAHRWWSKAATRYRRLGYEAVRLNARQPLDSKDIITLEGRFLSQALRTPAFISVAHMPMQFVEQLSHHLERRQAAHDLSYMLTAPAGRHIKEVLRGTFTIPDYKLVLSESGSYKVVYDDPRDGSAIIPRVRPLPSVTMKCPANTPHLGASLSDPATTSLELFAHAAINQADDFGLFEDRFYVNQRSTLEPVESIWRKVWKAIQSL